MSQLSADLELRTTGQQSMSTWQGEPTFHTILICELSWISWCPHRDPIKFQKPYWKLTGSALNLLSDGPWYPESILYHVLKHYYLPHWMLRNRWKAATMISETEESFRAVLIVLTWEKQTQPIHSVRHKTGNDLFVSTPRIVRERWDQEGRSQSLYKQL